MTLERDDQERKILNRLKRAQGQLGAVIKAIDHGDPCQDVLTQLSAVSTAIDRASFLILSCAMKISLEAEAEHSSGELSSDAAASQKSDKARAQARAASDEEGLESGDKPARRFLEGEHLSHEELEKLFLMLS